MRRLLTSSQQDAAPPVSPPKQAASSAPPAAAPPAETKPRGWGERLLRALWTIASVISMTVTIGVLVVVLVLWRNINVLLPTAQNLGDAILGGLYGNFVKMDEAHIVTTIPVDSSIHVGFDLPVKTDTTVILTEDVTIASAHVVINTPLFNINAPADVTLPAGTRLPIALDITVPVQTDVPVHLVVPVDIPLEETDLHEPFVGLQEVIKPYYCLLMPSAQLWDGRPVCIP